MAPKNLVEDRAQLDSAPTHQRFIVKYKQDSRQLAGEAALQRTLGAAARTRVSRPESGPRSGDMPASLLIGLITRETGKSRCSGKLRHNPLIFLV